MTVSISTPLFDRALTGRLDPKTMAAADVLAEIAATLARGYLRLVLGGKESQKHLELSTKSTAPCVSTVSGNGAQTGEEAA